MKTSTRKRVTAVLSATAVMVGAAVTIGANSAAAGPSGVTFSVGQMQSDGSRTIWIYRNSVIAGKGYWKANGDTLYANDQKSDGYYISAHLSTGRNVTTSGKPSPSTVSKGGNLTENKSYKLWACIGNNSAGLTCSNMYGVTS